MPVESQDSAVMTGADEVARAFKAVMGDLVQYLQDQGAMGVDHITASEETFKTVTSWGTRAWKQHRFTCQGPSNARIMIVDSRGGFYRDKAGRLLVKILQAMHLTPDQVYICNAADVGQIRSRLNPVSPEIIIALGREAAGLLLGNERPLEDVMGRFHTFCGVKVMPTRHPSELLEDPGLKRGVWEDMQKVMAEAGLGHGG